MTTMPFGKFKGMTLGHLDDGYLEWLAQPERELREPLRTHVTEEIAKRAGRGPATPDDITPGTIVEAGWAALGQPTYGKPAYAWLRTVVDGFSRG